VRFKVELKPSVLLLIVLVVIPLTNCGLMLRRDEYEKGSAVRYDRETGGFIDVVQGDYDK
jgi:hypothetical protein